MEMEGQGGLYGTGGGGGGSLIRSGTSTTFRAGNGKMDHKVYV